MPPRLPALQRLGTATLCLRPAAKPAVPNFLPIVQTANISQREKKRLAKQDPYRYAQAQQRKNANLKRQEELQAVRSGEWGDPVLGKSSPFVESFATLGQEGTDTAPQKKAKGSKSDPNALRNHFLVDGELEDAAHQAYTLTKPLVGLVEGQMDPEKAEEQEKLHQQRHEKAVEALRRITSIENSSARDRFHINVRRIVDELGRHQTDKFLAPRPKSVFATNERQPGRAGPDTGSPEVQIGILTAKIQGLATALQQNRGYKDKHNRRNLRLLLHRRQKLLKYMEKRERGGERWTHMLEKLGLTPATWKGQIVI
ncbi:ribosomal protein S15 precursor-like protein [Paramyrothecium foliicola]|nr:ribosomal protein S15 precursor-like protein [Paramyrothecium foliicola]